QSRARDAHPLRRQTRGAGRRQLAQETRNGSCGRMSARLLDGTAVANQIRGELRPAVEAFTRQAGRPPGLGIVLVGGGPASQVYVSSKLKSAQDTGLRDELERVPARSMLGI